MGKNDTIWRTQNMENTKIRRTQKYEEQKKKLNWWNIVRSRFKWVQCKCYFLFFVYFCTDFFLSLFCIQTCILYPRDIISNASTIVIGIFLWMIINSSQFNNKMYPACTQSYIFTLINPRFSYSHASESYLCV